MAMLGGSSVSVGGRSVSVSVFWPESTCGDAVCEALRSEVPPRGVSAYADLDVLRRELAHASPDVLFLDLSWEEGCALELLRDRCVPPNTRTIGVLGLPDEAAFFQGLGLGVSGWVHPADPPLFIAQSVSQVMRGEVPISARLSPFVLARVRPLTRPKPVDGGARPRLTPRERETLQFVAKGFSVAEVASLLQISRHTVTTHVRSIYRKLEVHSRSAAIYEAISLGLLQHL